MEEVIIRSSPGMFKEFLESTVWADIEQELNVLLEGVRDKLEETEGDEYRRHQGRASALRHALLIPQVIYDTLRADEPIEEEEE